VATVTSDIEPMDAGAGELNAAHAMNQGDAWAYCQKLSKYFGDAATGAISINITVLDGTTPASATITSSGVNVSNNDTLTISGVLITFVTGTPVGSQVKIGLTAQETLQNLVAFINQGGNADALSGIATALLTSPLVVTVSSTLPGTAGNGTTIAKVAASLTLSAATLTGGLTITGQHVISEGL
jgi:hypothetical protein